MRKQLLIEQIQGHYSELKRHDKHPAMPCDDGKWLETLRISELEAINNELRTRRFLRGI